MMGKAKTIAPRRRAVSASPFSVVIATMVDHNLKLTRDVPVLVRPESVGFVASFAEASVAASGTTIAEAIENLKDLLADHFHRLNEIPAEKLGPLPRRQLAMLRQFFE